MSKTNIIRSAGIISFATMISRVLGLVRDMIIAYFFGTSTSVQAFIVAFRIPNTLRDLVAEGAANAAFVPVLTEYHTAKSEKEFWRLSNNIFNIMFLILVGISILGIIFSPFIVRVIAPGFITDAQKLNLTISLNRIIFPFIFLVGLSTYAMGILNTLNHFSTPAFGPALFNLSLISAVCLLSRRFGVYSLAIGVLAGGAVQLLIQAPFLYKKGMRFDYSIDLKNSATRKIGKLLLPRAAGSCIYQMGSFIDTIFASFAGIVGQEAVAFIYYANRLIQLPIGVFGNAIAQASLPAMSAHASKRDLDKLRDIVTFSLRTTFIITIPAAIGLIVLARPIVSVLFERGQFLPESTTVTSRVLIFYAIGLFSYSAVKILANAFYAMQDTVTPVKFSSISLVLNIILNAILMFPLGVMGLALSTSASSIFNFAMLMNRLNKKIGRLDLSELSFAFLKILLASLIMGFFLFLFEKFFYAAFDKSTFIKAIYLVIIILIGILVFVISAFLFKIKELSLAIQWILKKK